MRVSVSLEFAQKPRLQSAEDRPLPRLATSRCATEEPGKASDCTTIVGLSRFGLQCLEKSCQQMPLAFLVDSRHSRWP